MEDKKTAVIVAWRDLWHPQMGGAEVYITKVAQKLRDIGYEVIFFTERYKGSKEEEVIDGIRYIRKGNAVTLHLFFLSYFKKQLKDNCDVLIENFNAVPFGVPKLHKNNLTIIHHVQSTEWKNLLGAFIGQLITKYFERRLEKVYRKGKKIVAVSPSTKKELVDIGFNPQQIKIIYNGIEIPVVDSIEKPSNKINILSIGRVKGTKHIEEGIEMVKHSVENGLTNIHLDIAGKGDDVERLKQLTKDYKVGEYVRFWGFVSEEKKIELLREAHLHVQFSRKEGWGITVIEASASATPTICYRVPGLVDSVKDSTGYFVNNSLEETWDRAINHIENNSPDYQEKQREGIKWAESFKWDKQMEDFITFLNSSE